MMKLGWKLITDREILWVRAMTAKYKCGNDLFPQVCRFREETTTWKGISSVWNLVKESTVLQRNEVPSWKPSSKGAVSISSAYSLLSQSGRPQGFNKLFQVIWSLARPQRLRSFLWLVANDALLTNCNRVRRRLTEDDNCCCCTHSPETTLHVLRDCDFAKDVWYRFVPVRSRRAFFDKDLQEWLYVNLVRSLPGKFRKDWCQTFSVTVHALWDRRNKSLFQGSAGSPDALLHDILRRVDELKCNYSIQKHIITSAVNKGSPSYWVAPSAGWLKMNVDASFISTHRAATGGIIRDHSGVLIRAFSEKIVAPSPLCAELFAILSGLNLASDHHCTHLILESDCKHAVDLIKSSRPDLMLAPEARLLVDEIKAKINATWTVAINHVNPSCNSCADGLARSALNLDAGLNVFASVPNCISHPFLADLSLINVS